MMARTETRHLVRLRVELKGVDGTGHAFKQTAFTHDVSLHGARLQETPPLVEAASVVEVQHRGRRSRFRVIWVGGPPYNAVGLESLDSKQCIWGSPLPGRRIFSPPPAS